MQKVIQYLLDKIIEESRMKAFTSEDQIHGYILGMLREKQKELHYVLKREVPTTHQYSKTEDGVLFINQTGKGRKKGNIDFWLESNQGQCGIELEYPRGQGRTNPEYFSAHIENDCIKLTNEKLDYRILLLFIYQDLPIGPNEIINIVKDYPEVMFICLRLRRQDEFRLEFSSVLNYFTWPKDWINVP